MAGTKKESVKCQICGLEKRPDEVVPAELVKPDISGLIQKDHPGWRKDGYICRTDLNSYRGKYVQYILETEKGDLSVLEQDVLDSLKKQELVSENLNVEFEQQLTFGERLADAIASFGGSWRFISIFAGVLVIWITINSIVLLIRPFDPFPFILLNLILSCLAAIQAPIIMMSQNRQESKDRPQGRARLPCQSES